MLEEDTSNIVNLVPLERCAILRKALEYWTAPERLKALPGNRLTGSRLSQLTTLTSCRQSCDLKDVSVLDGNGYSNTLRTWEAVRVHDDVRYYTVLIERHVYLFRNYAHNPFLSVTGGKLVPYLERFSILGLTDRPGIWNLLLGVSFA